MKNLTTRRLDFGQRVKGLRTMAGLSLRDMGEQTGITFSLIQSIEAGKRAVGGKLSEKLAKAFKLTGEARDQFLLQAAATRAFDHVVGSARDLPPEIVNYVAQVLAKSGLKKNEMTGCQLTHTVVAIEGQQLVEATEVKKQFQEATAGYMQGFKGGRAEQPILVVETANKLHFYALVSASMEKA